MIKNYFKIAWRSLRKNKLQTVINLLGLTVGTVCCLSILVYVMAQFGYDTHYEDAASLYRIRTKIVNPDGTVYNSATSSPPIAFALKEDFPEVEEACRVVYFGSGNDALLRVTGSNEGTYEPRGYLADTTFFKLFTYSFTEGRPAGALHKFNSVVLSSALAKKLFGNEKALNKNLILNDGDNELNLTITGVFDETTGKSHLRPNYVLSMNSPGLGKYVQSIQNFATENFTHSYVKLALGANTESLEKKFPSFLQHHGAEDLASTGFEKTIFLQRVKDIYLHSKGAMNQIDRVSDIKYLYVLLVLALFIQLMACINFINLNTAQANKRAREIGVRKVVGANKGLLVHQFIGESLMLSTFASLISIPLTALVLPLVNTLTQGNMAYTALLDWKILLLLLSLSLFTGLLAGTYPALVLSSIKPAKVLKGRISLQSGNGNFRRALVVFQFVVSIALITAVIIITQQVKYIQNMDMGFDKENLLVIRLGSQDISEKFVALKTQITAVPGVSQVAGSNHYPSENIRGDIGVHLPGKDPTNQPLVKYNGIDKDYFTTVGTPLLAGRDLRAHDSSQVIVNKATIDKFQIPLEDAVGTKLLSQYEGDIDEYEIVGVAGDYHFASLKEPITPLLLYMDKTPNWLIVKAKTTDFGRLLHDLERSWKSVNANTPFVYTFVDKEIEKLYAEEKRLSRISVVLTCLAILISCLGLFGLVSFIAEQKKKEIGIRKVLGADIGTVVGILAKDFVILVIIALLIATPLAYYFMHNWLQDFTYRISISWWIFVLAGGLSLFITLLTVSVQTIKAATANPVKSLRSE